MGNLAAIWPQTGSMVAIELGVLGATGKRRLFRVLSTVGGNLAEEDDQNGGNGDQLQLKLTTSHSGVRITSWWTWCHLFFSVVITDFVFCVDV